MEQITQIELVEFKLLATAAALEENERQKIFSLSHKDFSNGIAKTIFRKLKKLFTEFPNADFDVYMDCLSLDEKKTVMLALNDSVSPVLLREQLDDTLDYIKQTSSERRLKSELTDIVLSEEITKDKVRKILESSESGTSQLINSAEKYLAEYENEYEFVPTGFELLDNRLNGGFLKGTLSTIGARPSTGKTTFAINIATNNPDKKVMFFSLEMSSAMIYDRIIADKANISYSLTGRHRVRKETVEMILNNYESLTVLDSVFAVEDIVSLIYEYKPELVIIDYVQIITSREWFIDNRQRIDYISQRLKTTAKKIGCCIVTLSQLSRSAKEKATMSALKESGGLEQDSDYVLLLHRDYVNDKSKNAKASETELTLDKNKFGNTKEFKLNFDGKHQRFTEIEETGETSDDEEENHDSTANTDYKPIAHMAKNEEVYLDADGDLPF
ncbi:MAG: DnaB-like helicase C-terminal domain-containing protein [Acutalibacteraceae bacterium]